MSKIKSIKLMILVSLIFGLSGCITNPKLSKQFTSSNIGCEVKDIEIYNETAEFNGMHTWTAVCKGKKYLCTYQSTAGSKCKELME